MSFYFESERSVSTKTDYITYKLLLWANYVENFKSIALKTVILRNIEHHFSSIFCKKIGKFQSILRVRALFPQKLTIEPKSYCYMPTMLKFSNQ